MATMAAKQEVIKQPPLNKRPTREFVAIMLGGSLLALSSGMLNATTVASDRQLTSQPMTGTATMIGISVASGDSAVFGDKIGILLFHILGASVSGYLVPHHTFYMGSDYGRLLKISLCVLTGAFLVAKLTPDSVFWYYLVAFAGGVQNAMTSKYSGNILRTTHISGSVTDMGLIIGRRNFTLTAPMWKFYINLSIVSCYFLGALIGGYALKDLEDNQLLINISLYGLIIILYFIFVKKEKEYRCCYALLGFSTGAEVDYSISTSGAVVTAVPQSEERVDKHTKEEEVKEEGRMVEIADKTFVEHISGSESPHQPLSVTDEEPDSDEEEDQDEPLDNQITEEDIDRDRNGASFHLNSGKGEGTSIVVPQDLESADVSNHIQLQESVAKDAGTGTREIPDKTPQNSTSLPITTAAVVSPSSPHPPMKEMEHAWSYFVMMFVVCLLCFNAAFINATTKLSSKELFTSHITGATTRLALAITNKDGVGVTVRVIIIALYACGAVITGSVVKSDFYSLRAPYKRLFMFGTLLLTLGLVLHLFYPDAYYFYYCMALFCGMQSALGCKVKNSVLRTCYMSGTATDIGAAIGKVLKMGPTKAHLRPIQLLVPCLLSYIFGAFVAKLLFPVLGKYNTCVNIGIFIFLSILYWCFQHPRKVRHWLRIVGIKVEKGE